MNHRIILLLSLLAAGSVQAQVMERELGAFDLKLGTAPTRSMAQGLVTPTTAGAFHGGMDMTHSSGWYMGQWSPSAGLFDGSQLQLNSYLGYQQHPNSNKLGYELGMIRYSFPELANTDRSQLYAGLTLAGSRVGAAMSNAPGRTDSTLFVDLGTVSPLGVNMRVKYSNYELDNPVWVPGNGRVRVFNDWSVNLSRPWLGINLNLSYTASDLSGSDCAAYSGQNGQCDAFFKFKAERALF